MRRPANDATTNPEILHGVIDETSEFPSQLHEIGEAEEQGNDNAMLGRRRRRKVIGKPWAQLPDYQI